MINTNSQITLTMVSWRVLSPQQGHLLQSSHLIILGERHRHLFSNTDSRPLAPHLHCCAPRHLGCPCPQSLGSSPCGNQQHQSLNPSSALHVLGHVARRFSINLMEDGTIWGPMSFDITCQTLTWASMKR